MESNIIDLPELREQTHVFQDRTHTCEILAGMISADNRQTGIILASFAFFRENFGSQDGKPENFMVFFIMFP